jgi:ApaG protein
MAVMGSADPSQTITRGVRVDVQSVFVSERSDPNTGQCFFAYRVKIANEGSATAQRVSRHWVIIDGRDHVEEVRGPGVVGAQPLLQPDEPEVVH